MTPSDADPFGRIRDFVLAPADERAATVQQGIPSANATFDASRKGSATTSRRSGVWKTNAELGELEVSKIASRFGFVVRIDGDAQSRNEPGVKLFRFDDRSTPAGTFPRLQDALQWLMERPDTSGRTS